MSQVIKNLASGPVPPSVATTFTEDGPSTATPAANNLNVFGGTGIETSGLGSTITIDVVTGGFSWAETAISLGISDQVGVFCTAALTIFLPTTASLQLGSTVYIYSDTASAVVIQANTGQFIEITGSFSTSAGTATSNAAGSFVWLVFRPSDFTWHALSSMGTYTTA